MTWCHPSSAQANISILIVKWHNVFSIKTEPNPKAEKRKVLSLLVVKSTLVVDFLLYTFKNLKPTNPSEPGHS